MLPIYRYPLVLLQWYREYNKIGATGAVTLINAVKKRFNPTMNFDT